MDTLVKVPNADVTGRVAEMRARLAGAIAISTANKQYLASLKAEQADIPSFKPDLSDARLNTILAALSGKRPGEAVASAGEPSVPGTIPLAGKEKINAV